MLTQLCMQREPWLQNQDDTVAKPHSRKSSVKICRHQKHLNSVSSRKMVKMKCNFYWWWNWWWNLKYCRHILYDLTDHPSILPLFQGWDAGATGLAGCSRLPSHHRCFSAPPGGPPSCSQPNQYMFDRQIFVKSIFHHRYGGVKVYQAIITCHKFRWKKNPRWSHTGLKVWRIS